MGYVCIVPPDWEVTPTVTMVTVPLAQARRHAAGPIMRAAHAPEPGAAVSSAGLDL